MAQEFLEKAGASAQARFASSLAGLAVKYEPHVEFKRRVPSAIGIIRTGDTTPYGNVILESA